MLPLPQWICGAELERVRLLNSSKHALGLQSLFVFDSVRIFPMIWRKNVKGADVFSTVTNSCIHLVSNYGKRRKWKINGPDPFSGFFFQSPVTSVQHELKRILFTSNLEITLVASTLPLVII